MHFCSDATPEKAQTKDDCSPSGKNRFSEEMEMWLTMQTEWGVGNDTLRKMQQEERSRMLAEAKKKKKEKKEKVFTPHHNSKAL